MVGLSLTLFFTVFDVQSQVLQIGDFVLINSYLLQFLIPPSTLGILIRNARKGLGDIEKIMGLFEINPDIHEPDNPLMLTKQAQEITFKNVTYAYDGRNPILEDISFTIRTGQKVALVGASGTGKSTIVKLILRLINTSSGEILIGGEDISNYTTSAIRSAIGIIPQDITLFNESILYNIKYVKPDATEEEIHLAIKQANLDCFLRSLPQGVDNYSGREGTLPLRRRKTAHCYCSNSSQRPRDVNT